jgi:lysophospholipase L1-like esterase
MRGWLAGAVAVGSLCGQGVPRIDSNSRLAHEQLLAKTHKGRIDVYFEGDSITRRWGATDYPALLDNWKKNFFGWNAADFGWGADRIENILWRLENGELDGVNPKVIVLLAGTNNVGAGASVEEVAGGIEAVLKVMQAKAPAAVIVLTGIFPRNDKLGMMPVIAGINARLAGMADGGRVRYLNVNVGLTEGSLGDGLHPTVKGYQVWADGLRPLLMELLGAPAKEDFAPAATGDPSARR